jgi:O-antigen ligase
VYWCGLVLDVATVVLLCRAFGEEYAAHSLMKGFIAGSVLVAVIAWMMPAAEDLRLGDLDCFNTNQIANLCALAILMCTLLASRGDSVSNFATLFLAVTLLRSLSKATLIAFVAAQVYRLVSDNAMSARRKWLLVSGAAVLVICFWGLVDAYFGVYTTAGNQAETLTGRTVIWAWCLDAGLARPWFGNGFDAMWKVAPPFGGELFEARHAENELLQQFFAYGACGVALLMGVYGSLYRRCRWLPQGPQRSILISFLVFALVRGLAEAEPFDLLLPLWLIAALTPLVKRGRAPRRDMSMQPEYLSSASAVSAI